MLLQVLVLLGFVLYFWKSELLLACHKQGGKEFHQLTMVSSTFLYLMKYIDDV